MFIDVEEIVSRELREVADGLEIPAMPPLPQKSARTLRHWQPLLVAAAVVLIVAVVATVRGGQEQKPAPAPPSPPESVTTIPKTAPTVPYVVDQRLSVDGEQVPGTWWSVWFGGAGWLALRTDNTWWWGWGAEPIRMSGQRDVPPVISPNGRYVAETRTENGEGIVTGWDTRPAGEGLGGVPVDLGDPEDGSAVSVRAVTNDAKVIVQGTNTSLLWLPRVDNSIVDLTTTAPGQLIVGNAPAGLIVTNESETDPYLADISETGEITRLADLPSADSVVNPSGTWVMWPGSDMGGEVTEMATLEAQTLDGEKRVTLTAPDGWGFSVLSWAWEDDDHLVVTVVRDGGERMARCSVQLAHCELIKTH